MDLKDESKKYSSKDLGEFIVLPTLGIGQEGINYFKNLMGKDFNEKYIKEGEIFVDDEALHSIKKNYETNNHGKKLVHVYSANSKKACLKPSQLAQVKRQEGQAKYWQGWLYAENDKEQKEKLERDPNTWLATVGIPTITEPRGQNPEQEEIEHYIENLYFLIGQGKSICIPIRPRDWSSDQEKSKISKQKPDPNKYKNEENILVKKYQGKYEYAFGGLNAPDFLKIEDGRSLFEFLEKQLNLLNDTILKLHQKAKAGATLEELEEVFSKNADEGGSFAFNKKYQAAFTAGLKDRNAECLDHSKYYKKYNEVVKSTSVSLWNNVNTDKFAKTITNMGCTFSKKDNNKNHIEIKGTNESEVVDLIRYSNGYTEASTTNPNKKTYQMMFESMKALGVKEITIEVSGFSSKVKDVVWLEANRHGLEVKGYQPTEEFAKKHSEEVNKYLKTATTSAKMDKPTKEEEKDMDDDSSLTKKPKSKAKEETEIEEESELEESEKTPEEETGSTKTNTPLSSS